MKKKILNFINNILTPAGICINKIKDQQIRDTYTTYLENLLVNIKEDTELSATNLEPIELDVNFIIFSKDRALQLHALLSSFYDYVIKPVKVHVLYLASSEQHAQAYAEVKATFFDLDITFIKEQNFREDLIRLVNSLTVSKVVFLVDDIIFTDSLDLEDFLKYNTELYVPSLRMGKHLKFNYTLQLPQPLPNFLPIKDKEKQDKIIWRWQKGILDWNYPLSVDGHLFSVHEITQMLPLIHFKAPNSLEEAMQIFKSFYLKKLGVAYSKAKIVNIPCNKVQVENDNISEEVTVDYLLKKWQSGFQIDYAKLKHFQNISAHQFVPFTFIKRPLVHKM